MARKKLKVILDTNVFISGLLSPAGIPVLLDLVISSKANFLVTGDKKLQTLLLVENCSVVSPAEFIVRIK